MNVTDLETVPLHAAFDAVRDCGAKRVGIDASRTARSSASFRNAHRAGLRESHPLRDTRDTVSLEQRIAATRPADDLSQTAHAIAALDLPEASGTASALAAVLASATVRLAAGVHVARAQAPRQRRDAPRGRAARRSSSGTCTAAARDDADAWRGVDRRSSRAGQRDRQPDRFRAVDAALMGASEVPLRIARLATDVLSLAVEAAQSGDEVTAPDAWAAATISRAAVSAALGLLRGNLAMLSDQALAPAPHAEAATLVRRADALVAQARAAVGAVAG